MWAVRFLRGCSGVLTGGLVVLALVVAGTQWFGRQHDFPGPGVVVVGWHVAAAGVAVGMQLWGDRGGATRATVVAAGVVVITAVLLGALWWR